MSDFVIQALCLYKNKKVLNLKFTTTHNAQMPEEILWQDEKQK